jgi:hypothetical protein
VAWRNGRYKAKRKDWQEEEEAEVGSSEADESMFYRASSSEDSRVHHLQGASIDLDGVGCGITTATSTGQG